MKRILKLTLALAFTLAITAALAACSFGSCASHTDINEDGLCDVCGTSYSCPGHQDANGDRLCDLCLADYWHTDHLDKDGDMKCDKCKAPFVCEDHVDEDVDGKCDNCLGKIDCEAHSDKDQDGLCDECKAPFTCPGHVDKKGDGTCDVCKAKFACSHKDPEEDGRCNICQAPFVCDAHKDVGVDGICDKCYAPFVCSGHQDRTGDNKCDICGAPYEEPIDLREAFADAALATNPTSMTVKVESKFEAGTLTSLYTVTFARDGSVEIVGLIQRFNESLEGDLIITLPEVVITKGQDGKYSDGFDYEYLIPSTAKPVIDFMSLKSDEYVTTSTILEATIASYNTEKVLGVAYDYNVSLTVNKNEAALTGITVAYSNVVITCTYNNAD